jgi:hypothetical protein
MSEQRAVEATRTGRRLSPQDSRRDKAAVWSPGQHAHRTGREQPVDYPDLANVAKELAVRSRRRQGLPDHITDLEALAAGAQLVTALRRPQGWPRSGVPP